MQVDVYRGGLEHNDQAMLKDDNVGFVKVVCKAGTDKIFRVTIVASRAGINEVTLAMKHGIGLGRIGHNIHSYPMTGESLMGCGLQSINAKWKRLDND
jgi:pyruvate/2-oxoglutarate dehydrogenase complex dihydrolipoamide dehydrogenase (E3) component